MLWPRRGWTRMALYIQHRLGRLPGTPYRIAAGFACGAAISFTPFLGLHFVLAALGALALRTGSCSLFQPSKNSVISAFIVRSTK